MVCAVDGMAGVGKTAFAVHAAHRLAERYPDGSVFIDLYGFTPGLPPLPYGTALEQLLRNAGVASDDIPAGLAERRSLWQAVMSTRRMLILLDNARDADQVSPLLPGTSGSLVLITSRVKLYELSEATPLPLDVLATQESTALLRAVVGPDRSVDDDTATRIADACGRPPLAIRLVGARLRHFPHEAIDASLVEDLHGLPQEKALQRAFALSYDGLGEDLQRCFRLIGVHPGPDLTPEVMAAVMDVEQGRGRRLLRGLAEHNLAEHLHGSTYRFHDLVREFARRKCAEREGPDERAAALVRLTGRLAAWAQAAEELHNGGAPTHGIPLTDAASARAWVTGARENIRACLEQAPDPPGELAMAAARVLRDSSLLTDATTCLLQALEIFGSRGDRCSQARALVELARVDQKAWRYDVARERLEEALTVFQEQVDDRGRAAALTELAEVDLEVGKTVPSGRGYRDALELWRSLGDRRGEARVLAGLGYVNRSLSRYTLARQQFGQALAIAVEDNDEVLQGHAEGAGPHGAERGALP